MERSGRRTAGLMATAAMLAIPTGASAQEGVFPTGRDGAAFAVRNVRLFDGHAARAGVTVVVRDGRIAEVRPDGSAPEGMPLVDGSGRTLLPGLIDAHTHTFSPDHLHAAVALGVTTELDQFTAVSFMQAMHAEQATGDVTDRADLLSAGTLATVPGGHGTEYGMAVPTLTRPGDAASFVAARLEDGSDWIKIIMEDGSTYGRTIPSLDAATVGALIAAAHDDGLLAVVHVATRRDARAAVGRGADGLAHAPHDGEPADDFGAFLAQHGAFLTPTLTVVGSIAGRGEGAAQLADGRLAALIAPDMRAALESAFPTRERTRNAFTWAARATRLAAQAGVPILVGTDAGNPGTAHGVTLHRELENLVEAGLTPVEALTAATAAPAEAYGLDDRGRIAEGMRADLVLVAGDPTTDILATRDLVAVWRNGAPIDLAAARSRVAHANEEAAAPLPVPGPVSDFDDGTLDAAFGAGWTTSTDAMAGGTSTASLTPRDGALLVEGEVTSSGPSAWAGAMLFPGPQPMAPADLSAAGGLSFRVRGAPGSYTVMLFARSTGSRPVMRPFEVGDDWREVRMDFADFPGVDPAALMGVFLGVAGRAGAFSLQVDDVAFH